MALLAMVMADDDPAFAAHLRPKPISSHPCSGPDCLKLGVLKCSRCHAGEEHSSITCGSFETSTVGECTNLAASGGRATDIIKL